MSQAGVTVSGHKEIRKRLESLRRKLQKQILRKAVASSTAGIARVAKSKAPIHDGVLKKSIKRKIKANRKRVSVTATIAADEKIAPHGHLVEFGTAERTKKSTGQNVGVMPPNPFMRRSFAEVERPTGAAVVQSVVSQIEAEASKT